MTELDAEDNLNDRKLTLLKNHVAQILEHFDSVQIFAVSRARSDEHDVLFNYGGGSYYERVGAVKEWIVKENARSRRDANGD